MLDDVSLRNKTKIAREWFRRSRAGEFQFTGRHADKFEELLESIEEHAKRVEPPPTDVDVALADNVVRLFVGGQH